MREKTLRFLSRFSRYSIGLAIAFGLMVLTGWILHIQRLKGIVSGQVSVKANTGVCFVLMGMALWLVQEGKPSRYRQIVSRILAVVVALVGLLSFLECWYGWDLRIDQLLFTAGADDLPGSVRPGLMSPITALDFLLLGVTVGLLDVKRRWSRWIQALFAGITVVASVFGILDFVLDPGNTHTHIAPLTATMLFLFSFAVLCARTEWGLGKLLATVSPGGELARRMVPPAILSPIVIGWLRWKGQESGLYSDWTGTVIMMVSAGMLLTGLTLWTAFSLDRIELQRVRAEESVQRLASIVMSCNDAIIGETLDGIVTSWNPGAEAVYGYSAEEMVGHGVTQVIPSHRRDEFEGFLRQIRSGESVLHYETERERKDGKTIFVSLSVSPIRDANDKIVGASTIARDVTERKKAEEELRRISRYSRSLIEASLDPLVTISKDGKITDVNEATEKATGFPRNQLIGTDFSDYFTEPYKARAGYQQVFEKGFVCDYPLAICNTSGSVMEVLYNATVFKGANGEVEGAFAAARDITDRKRAEEALKRSESRYRSLVTATSQIVWTTNRDGEVIDDMPMWRAYTGLSQQQLSGAGWLDSVHPDDRNRTEQVWAKAWRNRERYEAEYRIRSRDGAYRWFSVRGVPVLENDDTVREWVGTCTDITERKLAEEEVRRLNDELEQRVVQRTAQLEAANKELEAFTYSVSHDLRAPLRHISGFSKMLSEEFAAALPPEAQHHVERIQEGTLQMGRLVDDLLNLGRVGRKELSLQVAGLRSIVDEVITNLKSDMGDRQVDWKIGDLPYVECDTALIQQVFQNLLSNALKFTRPRSQAVIDIGQTQKDGNGVVYVRDNGVGFSMKYADKLFGVFQRLHRAEDFEGTGVGLATVQRIIQKHGGRIWAEGELDKGAAFYFTLGAAETKDSESRAAYVGAKA